MLNICLHILASKATGDLGARLASIHFLVAFITGTVSLLGIFAFYRYLAGANLALGIVVMGPASIIGGTLYGVMVLKKRMDSPEWILFALIFAVYLWRAVSEFYNQS